jgi:hypothetical protein
LDVVLVKLVGETRPEKSSLGALPLEKAGCDKKTDQIA